MPLALPYFSLACPFEYYLTPFSNFGSPPPILTRPASCPSSFLRSRGLSFPPVSHSIRVLACHASRPRPAYDIRVKLPFTALQPSPLGSGVRSVDTDVFFSKIRTSVDAARITVTGNTSMIS